MNGRKLFISHAAVDRELAALLEETVIITIPGIKVFRASRVGQIKAGREWFDLVTSELRDADQFLVILTEASVGKPWVLFETGAAWYTKRPLMPILAPGFLPQNVHEPLRFLQLLSLGNPSEVAQIFKELGGNLTDPQAFVLQATKLAELGRQKAMQEKGWKGVDYEGNYYAFDGPLEMLPEADPVPMPHGLFQAFRDQGFDQVLGIPNNLTDAFSKGYKRVWLINAWQKKHPLLSQKEKQQLCVRPKEGHQA